MKEKETLRKKYRLLRSELTDELIHSQSHQILHNFSRLFDSLGEIRHVHIFLPIQRLKEVDTFLILDLLWSRKIQVYTSILSQREGCMKTVFLDRSTQFELDGWGIPKPREIQYSGEDSIQLVLVPLLAVDSRGNRIGYGKGFYDEFLARLDRRVIKVGVGFFEPEASLPIEKHDVSLDFYLWPLGISGFDS